MATGYDRRLVNTSPLGTGAAVVTDQRTAMSYFDALPKELREVLTQAIVPISAETIYHNLLRGYPVASMLRAIAAKDEENRQAHRAEATAAVQWAGTIMKGIKV